MSKNRFGAVFLTNWCTKIGFVQFWANRCGRQVFGQDGSNWPKTCPKLANTGLSLLCSWLLTCCLFFSLPPPFPPNSPYNLNTCKEALQHMYRLYTVLKSVWLYLTPFPLCSLEGHVMQNAVDPERLTLTTVLYSSEHWPPVLN